MVLVIVPARWPGQRVSARLALCLKHDRASLAAEGPVAKLGAFHDRGETLEGAGGGLRLKLLLMCVGIDEIQAHIHACARLDTIVEPLHGHRCTGATQCKNGGQRCVEGGQKVYV